MFITALCPTFRHPSLLASSLALWDAQTYPREKRRLIILDDGQTFDDDVGDTWELHSARERLPSLPAKYNLLLALAPPETDAFLVWEDDDTYLPAYVERHARCLAAHELSHPERVLSDYPGYLISEPAAGRFHSALGFRKSLIERIGGWPVTDRADFDQQLQSRLHEAAESKGDPFAGLADREIPYVYGWHTGHAHCQSTMRAQSDDSWYARGAQAYAEVPHVGRLVAQYDRRTRSLLHHLRGAGAMEEFRVEASR